MYFLLQDTRQKVGEVKLPDSENYALKLVIPNKEVREVFILQIQEWFKEVVAKDNDEIRVLSKAILEADTEKIQRQLNIIMDRMISILDTKARDRQKENFYHGLFAWPFERKQSELADQIEQGIRGWIQ